MTETDHEDWKEDEARALRDLGREAAPSPDLKRRVVEGLADSGQLFRPRSAPVSWMPWAMAATFAVLAFGLGRATASGPGETAPAGGRYVLLLTGGASTSPADNEERRHEYGDWLSGLQKRGLGITGEELVGESHDLPGPRNGEPVVGYFIINAGNESEALAIARTTPHLRHGGGVTVAALR